MLEVFSLPPFLDDLEHSLLLHTLRAYPRGLPADGLLIEPEDRPSASAAGGRVPRPVSFSSGMEYVVLKAQRRAAVDSKWTDWRAMRSTWRGLIGLPPLRDPGPCSQTPVRLPTALTSGVCVRGRLSDPGA